MPARVTQLATPTLTGRELEVLRLIGAGLTTQEISALLGVTRRTIENHKRRIFAKLGVQSQAHAVASAARLGLLAAPAAEAGMPVVLGQPGPVRELPGASRVVVLVDPSPEDWQAAARLEARVVLVCSGELDQTAVVQAFLRGADAVVPAARAPEELVPVVELVGSGCTLIHPAHLRALVDVARLRLAAAQHPSPALTPREREILVSIDRGDSVKQTARSLGIAVKTVENLQGRLFRKLGVRNRAQAVAAAHALGLLSVR